MSKIRGTALLCCLLGSVCQQLLAQDTLNFPVLGEVISLDPEFANLIAPEARLEVISSGFEWAEGPLWINEAQGPGYLLFSDIPRNSIMKWIEGKGVSLYMKPSGYTGVANYKPEPGSNGLILDKTGRLVCCEHGDRRLSVLTEGGGKRTLVDNYQGKRLNSPNDVTLKSNGDLYFTDPPYGLPKQLNDPHSELGYCGVYRLASNGELTLLTKELTRPNGIGFSPDEKTLYVANSDPARALLMAYPVNEDGTLGPGKVFVDLTDAAHRKLPGLPDGFAIDRKGNVFASGPGGIYVFNNQGKALGRISGGERLSNCTFGGPDGSMLYITADMYLCRIQTKTSK